MASKSARAPSPRQPGLPGRPRVLRRQRIALPVLNGTSTRGSALLCRCSTAPAHEGLRERHRAGGAAAPTRTCGREKGTGACRGPREADALDGPPTPPVPRSMATDRPGAAPTRPTAAPRLLAAQVPIAAAGLERLQSISPSEHAFD
eukprot:CAMPEP_0196670632 /NCGR_PEP_ID=MMETSP1090-20130531/1357_1 /TAXON_ID=37098 /ORGANISM="Isochrysis sp, Strain CCMP1244" /LENGTH=146 /DNA_ID=CAMNT_0042008247 /DNA_START=87 /DNA_END=524 /DNA_ORIENTATION=-